MNNHVPRRSEENKTSLILSFYQPWVYAGAERFTQLIREELRQGRVVGFLYVSDASCNSDILSNISSEEYARLALYKFVPPDRVEPVSPYAIDMSGHGLHGVEEVVRQLDPWHVRAHHPVHAFADVIDCPTFRERPLIYDIMDLWEDFTNVPWGNRATEIRYVERADAVTAVSRLLFERVPQASSRHIVPNAVDRLFLRRIAPEYGRRQREANVPKRILYMGTMWGSWFDWELVHRLTRSLTDHSFRFIGSMRAAPEEDSGAGIELHVQELRKLSNVEIIDEVPHDDLVPWLRWADVGLIPFKVNALTAAVSPLKVFEHLGAGSVVVSTEMPDIEAYPGVRIADSADDFVRLVANSDGVTLSDLEAADVGLFCEANTWKQRLAQLDQIIQGLL